MFSLVVFIPKRLTRGGSAQFAAEYNRNKKAVAYSVSRFGSFCSTLLKKTADYLASERWQFASFFPVTRVNGHSSLSLYKTQPVALFHIQDGNSLVSLFA